MKSFFIALVSVLLLSSCSEFQKVLKSENIGEKYAFADSLYNMGKYRKSLRLWEQIVPSYRGKPQAERIMYLYADSYYQVGDYYMSGYQFERFASAYPTSEKTEEAEYKSAMSYAELSPRYTLDQGETEKALDKLQFFIGKYPDSEYAEIANQRIIELSTKVQKKAFEIAKGYNKIIDYPSAIAALDDFIYDYPGSPFREAAFYWKLDSQYNYAIGSLDRLVEPRLEEAALYYDNLIRSYPEGEYREEADKMKEDIDKRLQQSL